MFNRVGNPPAKLVTIYFEGEALKVEAGISVAAAVLDASRGIARTTHKGGKRGPYCHMGVCHECLMTIDGVPNQQSCIITVAEGMRVIRQDGPPDFNPSGKRADTGKEAENA